MDMRDTDAGFGLPSRALHWASALLILLAWAVGTTMEALPKGAPRAAGFELHVGLGALVLFLAAARLLWRLGNPHPSPPPGISAWEARAARLMHVALYALLLLLPATGLLAAWLEGKAVRLFWLWPVPSPVAPNRALGHSFEEAHEVLADLLLVLVGLHVAAALWHHFVRRDGVLRQMLRGAA
jgi:cytochrome b561